MCCRAGFFFQVFLFYHTFVIGSALYDCVTSGFGSSNETLKPGIIVTIMDNGGKRHYCGRLCIRPFPPKGRSHLITVATLHQSPCLCIFTSIASESDRNPISDLIPAAGESRWPSWDRFCQFFSPVGTTSGIRGKDGEMRTDLAISS